LLSLLGENIRPLTKVGSNCKPKSIDQVELGLQLFGVGLARMGVRPFVRRKPENSGGSCKQVFIYVNLHLGN
jgi:hypothetical protein